jgi:hypothetical protein
MDARNRPQVEAGVSKPLRGTSADRGGQVTDQADGGVRVIAHRSDGDLACAAYWLPRSR